MERGRFITFEGCEGVGKSTQVEFLKKYLTEKNVETLFLREPGGTKVSESIRTIILDKTNTEMTPECETMLYCAARAQLVGEVIKPNLEKGVMVVCDRFIDSTFAYQGVARGLGAEYVNSLNVAACNGIMPDLTIFLDLEPRCAFNRKGGADKDDRLELEGIAFHEKVYEGYLKACELYPNRIVRIVPDGNKYETQEKIRTLLKSRGYID